MNKILLLLATSLTVASTAPQTSIEYDRGYLAGIKDGADMAIAAVNTQMCLNKYNMQGGHTHPECAKFIEHFSVIDKKYEIVKKRVEETDKNGKDSNRSKKNPG
tara:strand:+ start:184 stop:495 length:312 start_codon:yes stop_codon:yes gene_type:complete